MVCLGYCKTQSRIQNASNVNISFTLITNLFLSSLKKMIAAGFNLKLIYLQLILAGIYLLKSNLTQYFGVYTIDFEQVNAGRDVS